MAWALDLDDCSKRLFPFSAILLVLLLSFGFQKQQHLFTYNKHCCGVCSGFRLIRILLHSSLNFELRRQYTKMFVAEFRTSRKWLMLMVTMDHTEKGWCPCFPHIMASLMVINSWMLRRSLERKISVRGIRYNIIASLVGIALAGDTLEWVQRMHKQIDLWVISVQSVPRRS